MMTENNCKKTIPSLASLSSTRQQNSTNKPSSLAQLRQKTQTPNNTTPSLNSLATSSTASKKPLSSLQALAQRSNASGNSTPSLISLAQKMSTANSVSTSKNKLTSLAHLASRTPLPAASLPPSNSLANFSTKKITANQEPVIPSSSLLSISKPSSLMHLAKKTEPELLNEPELPEKDKNGQNEDNALCAKPSIAAQFLFMPIPSVMSSFDPQTVFEHAIKKSTSIPRFQFDQPSPDDIVLAAQNNRSGASGNGSSKKA
ncbi:MAG: hypothetical protein EXX96DRAFT_293917 [Benjaminiella poitrasii]|nr:MAG: hypothetical protein EXX96DRAFT_293917 [Benjaminiella poitrasii]